MTYFLRRSLTKLVLSPIRSFIDKTDFHRMTFEIPAKFKYFRPKNSDPQFEISWDHLLQSNPDLEQRLLPESLHTCLKNQDLASASGIPGIKLCFSSANKKLIFSLDQTFFAQEVLGEFSNNIENLFESSPFFSMITPERIVIDYSSPNIAKPFHYGHFRSTIMGKFFDNLFRCIGHDVTSINYIGDWGLQYGILATGYNSFGSEEELKQNPIKHLHEVYVQGNKRSKEDPAFASQARDYFKQMELGKTESIEQWRKFKILSLENLNKTYQALGIQFDETHGESMYAEKTNDVLKILLKNNIAYENDDGSIQTNMKRHVNGNDNEEGQQITLKKNDGTSLYLTRDLAAAIDRQNQYHFDSMYYVVDSSQSKHFSNLFNLLSKMEYPWHSNLHFVPFGRISNFSTRKGSTIYLQDILDEAQAITLEGMKASPNIRVHENLESVAFILGVSSLIINDLCFHRKRNYEFDWNKVLSMSGNSGITLQYCHARLHSLKQNCGIELSLDCDVSPLVEPQALHLIDVISRFDEKLFLTYQMLEPYKLVTYLFDLRAAIGSAHKVLFVKDQPQNIARARLLLFHTAQLILSKGLKLLNISPLNEM